jgi:prepilin peptidase dependent protein B
LLVGIAVGLFLIAGAASLFVSNLSNSRKMLVEARVDQDLRAVVDLISRDLRRSGYWANAISGTVATTTATTPPRNQYTTVALGTSPPSITYSFARDTNDTVQSNEQFGFRLNAGTIEMQIANGNWQAVTDPAVLTVTAMTINPSTTPIDVRDSCVKTCCSAADVTAGTCATANITPNSAICPIITVRQYEVILTGQAAIDSKVVRTLRTRVKARNDLLDGVCPV